MGKVRFNTVDFADENSGLELIPASSDTGLTPLARDILPAVRSAKGSIGQLANAISPTAAAASIINTALDAVRDISRCIAAVSAEKQRTCQIQAQTYAQIEESKQQTRRIGIQQTEETRRFIAQCKNDLRTKKLELESLREKLSIKTDEIMADRRQFMNQLSTLSKIVDSVIEDKKLIYQMLPQLTGAETLSLSLLQKLDDANARLVELSKQIIALKQG